MGKSLTRQRGPDVGALAPAFVDHRRELWLLVVLFFSTFATVSLLGYSAHDPTLLRPAAGTVENPCGPAGALVADVLLSMLGYGAYLVFGVMVGSVFGIAGRRFLDPARSVGLVGVLASGLGILHLLYGPGDAFGAGGAVGAAVASMLETSVGRAGAWLVLPSLAAIMASVTFQIPWRALASRIVWYAETGLQGFGKRALTGLFSPLSSAGADVITRVTDSVERMGTSLTRREDDTAPWTVPSELEQLPDNPAGFTPASYVETTQVNAPDALAEVRYVPTSDQAPPPAPRPPQVQPEFGAFLPRGGFPADGDPANMGLYREPATAPRSPVPVEFMHRPRKPRVTGGIRRSVPSSSDATPVAAPARVVTPPPGPRPAVVSLPPRRGAAPAPPARDDVPPSAPPPPVSVPTPTTEYARVQPAAFLDQLVIDDGGVVAGNDSVEFQLPTLSLLDPVPPQQAHYDPQRLEELAAQVEDTLGSFKVTGTVTDVRVGPVVTTFEFLPGKGISVRKIANLQDDLAMGLKAMSVRIVAPIPGKGVVGIEIPSEDRLTVYLRQMLASDEFRDHRGALPVVLGKDVEGAPMVDDLAKMPHLLVGGTTGSGKSVGVNGMLLSLLFRKTPDELRLLLIDPKKLEFKMYADIPHLLHPVVTEPKQASAALAWACREMDQRYALLAQWDCRNIAGYNRKVERELREWSPDSARQYAPTDWSAGEPLPPPRKLPYIVIVIDELADLMLVARKEVEGSIARLTQMARACGIHLVVATQRPSVDVVTGLIKSNLPTRISFKLRSGTDSRTILDTVGADALLGRGDMLYLPNAGDITRLHGPFASDDETLRVLDFLRRQGVPQYVDGVVDDADDGQSGIDDDDLDALFEDAVSICVKAGKASTSMIQRHLKIGYNRAARIVDQMEARGIVGPADGARPREVLGSGSRRDV